MSEARDALVELFKVRCNEWLMREDWGPQCAGCGADEYRIDGYCSIECRDFHCDYDLRDALEDVEFGFVRLEEQFEAMRGVVQLVVRYDEAVLAWDNTPSDDIKTKRAASDEASRLCDEMIAAARDASNPASRPSA